MKILFDCRYTRFERHDGISRFTSDLVRALARLTPVTMIISDERQLALLPDLPWVKGPSPTAITEPWVSRRFNRFAAGRGLHAHADHGAVRASLRARDDGARPHLLRESHSAARPGLADPSALAALSPVLGAPARTAGTGGCARDGLGDHPRALMLRAPPDEASDHRRLRTRSTPAIAHRDARRRATWSTWVRSCRTRTSSCWPDRMALLPGYTLHLLSRADEATVRRLTAPRPRGLAALPPGGERRGVREHSVRRATALVSASLNEGFGLPLIEAMAGGTPVAVSDIPIFREIGGDAAVFFDPMDPESFAAAIRRLEDSAEWQRRSAASIERAGHYSWDASAKALLGALTAVYESRRRSPDPRDSWASIRPPGYSTTGTAATSARRVRVSLMPTSYPLGAIRVRPTPSTRGRSARRGCRSRSPATPRRSGRRTPRVRARHPPVRSCGSNRC